MHVWLDRVLLRDQTLSPEEILMSESQERMCAIVTPAKLDEFMALIKKWDVEAVVIGEVNASGRLTVDWHGEQIVDVPPRSVAHDGPVYERPYHRPSWQDALQADSPDSLPRPTDGEQLRATLIDLIGAPNLGAQGSQALWKSFIALLGGPRANPQDFDLPIGRVLTTLGEALTASLAVEMAMVMVLVMGMDNRVFYIPNHK
jgi:phosphoribosylformylglycinamidine (FGAM) synthase-like enzyme